MSTLTPTAILETQMEVQISGTPETVWDALTENIGAWWPPEFYAGGEPQKRRYYLEARPGGRMYEEWDGGGGLLWGTVATLNPGRQLQVVGSTFPNWGGPSVWFGTWDLEAVGDETRLSFSESTMGNVSESRAAGNSKAWEFLFGTALKSYVEGTPCPPWKG